MKNKKDRSHTRHLSAANQELVRQFEERFDVDESGWISVYRRISSEATGKKKLKYLGKFYMHFLDENYIQEKYGAGTYVLKLLDSRGRWLRQTTIRIAARISQL